MSSPAVAAKCAGRKSMAWEVCVRNRVCVCVCARLCVCVGVCVCVCVSESESMCGIRGRVRTEKKSDLSFHSKPPPSLSQGLQWWQTQSQISKAILFTSPLHITTAFILSTLVCIVLLASQPVHPQQNTTSGLSQKQAQGNTDTDKCPCVYKLHCATPVMNPKEKNIIHIIFIMTSGVNDMLLLTQPEWFQESH